MPRKMTLDELVDEAEADAEVGIEGEGEDLLKGAFDIAACAVRLFEGEFGDEASASANVMTDDGMVRITVTITEVD